MVDLLQKVAYFFVIFVLGEVIALIIFHFIVILK